MKISMKGVLSPVVTAFDAGRRIDAARMQQQCRWLLDQGVGLALFGTNSEGNSLSVQERTDLLDSLVSAGIPAARMMPGTGACAVADAVRLSAHCAKLGCGGVLMLPPFYYKGVSDEGLYRYFASVIEGAGDARLQVYLYHIPPVSQVGISLPLIERLLKAYPASIAGLKDSSEDWNNTRALIDTFSAGGFDVFCGSEVFLLQTLRQGGAGCISATANVNPAAIHALHAHWQESGAEARQASLDAVRAVFRKYPMIPALKFAVAHWSGHPSWATVRPPLVELTTEQRAGLLADLQAIGFDMPGLKG
jgi:4-hydroxy-tetrahydrodipicolinate synthase